MNPLPAMNTIGQCATLACVLEVTAPKPGNVHRGADFEELRFLDFLVSATRIGPVMERAVERGVGATVFDAIHATREVVPTNTNLGIVLLLAPLAAVPRNGSLREGVAEVLSVMTPQDAEFVYRAIALANPGGMGKVESMDVADAAPPSLLDAMHAAQSRDMVARQYACNFENIFEQIVPWLREGCDAGWPLTAAIVHAQLRCLSRFPDSLIARKCGEKTAQQASDLAAGVLDAGAPFEEPYEQALASFDFWLRCDGHRRNPGTTADLLTAGLFVLLRDGLVKPPYR